MKKLLVAVLAATVMALVSGCAQGGDETTDDSVSGILSASCTATAYVPALNYGVINSLGSVSCGTTHTLTVSTDLQELVGGVWQTSVNHAVTNTSTRFNSEASESCVARSSNSFRTVVTVFENGSQINRQTSYTVSLGCH